MVINTSRIVNPLLQGPSVITFFRGPVCEHWNRCKIRSMGIAIDYNDDVFQRRVPMTLTLTNQELPLMHTSFSASGDARSRPWPRIWVRALCAWVRSFPVLSYLFTTNPFSSHKHDPLLSLINGVVYSRKPSLYLPRVHNAMEWTRASFIWLTKIKIDRVVTSFSGARRSTGRGGTVFIYIWREG